LQQSQSQHLVLSAVMQNRLWNVGHRRY
jgi:hypothetical protein